MTTEQLAKTETELYSKVLDLIDKDQTEEHNQTLKTIFTSYRKVHKHYSDLANEQDEALKRGLFLQWYALTEPNYLTGLDELDEGAEKKIIDLVEEKIKNNSLDNELKWMLNYYANWDFVFERFKNRKSLTALIASRPDELPIGLVIDRTSMKERGQMGKYWNSLNHFSKDKNASS